MYCCDRCGKVLHKGDGHSQYSFPRVVKVLSVYDDADGAEHKVHRPETEQYTVSLCKKCAIEVNNAIARALWANDEAFEEQVLDCLD